ncbi:hypothetical protein D9Q98_007120 [Chlorella vulgaris]|uniref:Cytochrome P450 n=1 Tax=Chlorella vulgaris TaxID=3077 RepID=A0A9D4TJI8_CHLVU|nr:hypothetical protein D9Q98_007120 [Chlorella vulgaris]
MTSETASVQADNDLPSFPFARPSGYEPAAEYAEIRASKCPMAKAKLFDGSPIWMATKLEDLQAVLVDDRFSKVRTHPGFPELSPGAKAAVKGREASYVDMDPPEHTRYRSIFEPFFNEAAAAALRPSIEAKVNELIDGMERQAGANGGSVDLVEAFSLPLAFRVIYELLGVPVEDYETLSSNVAVRASGSSNARDAAAAQEKLTAYMESLIASKEASPSDDMLSRVIEGQLKPGLISRESLVAHAFLHLVAGNATVASMINLGLVSLLEHPDQMEALRKDPSLMPGAVEEICRYHTASALALRRVALTDVEVGGVTVRAGEGIIALNQSANRDEAAFPEPDKFDIRRDASAQVAYGYGTHKCVAMPLAMAELEVAFSGLLARLPSIKLAVPADQLQWSNPKGDVGLKSLPVTW